MSAFNNNIKSETQLPKKQQFLQSNSDKKLEVICGDVTEDHQMVNNSRIDNLSEMNVCQRVGFDKNDIKII
jgi:hypothetical protein